MRGKTGNNGKQAKRGLITKIFSPVYSSGIDRANFLVAETENGALIGCAQIKQHPGGVREIATVAIDKAWRGKGISNAGVRFILESCPRPLWGTCLNNYVPYFKKLGAVEITDSRQMPSLFRRRQRFFNILLRLFRSRKRLSVIVFPE